MPIQRIDHVQLAMPRGGETSAIAFYEGLLGLPNVPKPPHLARRGGCWFEGEDAQVHLGVDPDFRPARKAHPALLVADLAGLVSRLRSVGVEIRDGEPLEGFERVYVDDPFGNRVELMEPTTRRVVDQDDTTARPMGGPDAERSTREVYDHSVEQYVDAIGTRVSDRFEAPLDRALLDAYSEVLIARGSGRVLDVGCGPGRIARHLADRGIDASGVDLSPGMVDAARAAHPDLEFGVASLTSLPVPDRSLAGAVYWYSIIATPMEELGAAWRELDRVLAVDGEVLIAFQAGNGESVVQPNAYGSSSQLTLYRHSVDAVTASLAAEGFDVRADVRRQPELDHETDLQAFLLVSRASPDT